MNNSLREVISSGSPFAGIPHRRGKRINFKKLNRDIDWNIEMARRQKIMAERLLPYRSELRGCPICNSARLQVFVVIHGLPALGHDPEAQWVTSGGPRHAHLDGFDLHANVAVRGEERERLEQLCRYILRPVKSPRLAEPSTEHLAASAPKPA
jgi:hypothetical protein